MRFRLPWLFASLALVIAPAVSGQQATRPAAPGTARAADGLVILGRVVDGITGQPLGGAVVRISGGPPAPVGSQTPPRVIADGQGQFVLRDVAPGSHQIAAESVGYVPGSFGQRGPQAPSQSLDVRPDQPVTQVTLRLWKYAALNGTVFDELGDPAPGIQVRAMRRIMVDGRSQFGSDLVAAADDRGVYRLRSLVPGEYIVAVPSTTTSTPISSAAWFAETVAAGRVTRGELLRRFDDALAPIPDGIGIRLGDQLVRATSIKTPTVTRDGRVTVYPTTYHPSATAAARATFIAVKPGDDVTGVDIRLERQTSVTVEGLLVGPDGPAPHVGVSLVMDAATAVTQQVFKTADTVSDPSGRFTLIGVPAGQYRLEATRLARAATPQTPEPRVLSARQSLSVANEDVQGVTLTLVPGARVSGRVEFDGTSPRPAPDELKRVSVRLVPGGGDPTSVGADGNFRMPSYPPGQYFVSASCPGSTWALKAVLSGGRNLIDQPIDLGSTDVADVVIHFTDRAPELSGSVRLPPGDDADALVMLFPADYEPWRARGMAPARIRTARIDAAGAFRFTALLDGNYLVIAIPVGVVVNLEDAAQLARLAAGATPVAIPEGGRPTVSLPFSTIR
jgi:hypothetical protein